MRRIKKLFAVVISLLPALTHSAGVMASVPSSDDAWQQAQSEDSLPGYTRFILDHPDSPYADTARAKIERFQDGVDVARVMPKLEQPLIDAGSEKQFAPSAGGLLMNI